MPNLKSPAIGREAATEKRNLNPLACRLVGFLCMTGPSFFYALLMGVTSLGSNSSQGSYCDSGTFEGGL